ncbi:MAG: hypothetical protein WAO35_20185 [Terriglobia bacterium]
MKPTLTAKRIAAGQTNGKRSRGPAPPAGRERIRAAHTRHGFYSQAEAVAWRALGEKPEDFDAVVKAGSVAHERATEIVFAHPNATLMQRMKESSFRQIWRITNLFLKVQRQARRRNLEKFPREPVMFMKEKKLSEEWRGF